MFLSPPALRATRRALVLLCACASVTLAAPPSAHATPQDIFGFGARTPGMAMTGASYVDDFEAVFAKPAGLAGARRMALVLGLTGGAYRLRLDGDIMPTDASQGMTIGFQLPLPFTDELENVFVIGAGFFTPTNTVLRNNVLFVDSPQWPVVDRAQVVALQMAAGINLDRWVPGLRIGGGVSAMAQNLGRLIVELDPSGDFASVTEVQLTTSFSPILGVQYQRERWALGVTYRGELRTDVALDVQVNDLPIALPALTIDALAHFDPHTLTAEVSFFPVPSLMLVANLTYRRWSAWTGAPQRTTEDSFEPPEPRFRDTVSPRIAAEWRTGDEALSATLRGGFAFDPTPAPRAGFEPGRDSMGQVRLDPNGRPVLLPVRYLDGHRYVLTAGTGIRWQTRHEPLVRFDLFAQAQRIGARTHSISADAVSPSDTGPHMRSEGWILALGWTGGLEW